MTTLAPDAAAAVVTTTLPARIRAGEPVSFAITVRPARSLAAGSVLGFARVWPSDWGAVQTRDPEAPDYAEVAASNGARATLRAERHAAWHPFDHAIFVTLADPLDAAGALTIGFRNARAQTFIERAAMLRVRMRAAGAEAWEEIGAAATEVVGAAAERLVATAPSVVSVGQPFRIHLRAEDRWGNPASGVAVIVTSESGARGRLTSATGSTAAIDAVLNRPGIHRLTLRDDAGRTAVTNPIRAEPEARTRLFWGDLHAQSAIGCGAQSITDYYRFARDFAALDFAGHQGNCFLISNPEWQETIGVTRRINADGRFVALLGYEWSGATPVGGDHNVYFPGDAGTIRRCSHRHLADRSDTATDLPHVTDLHDAFRGTDTLLVVHVGGRTTNLQWHEPSVERLLEVHSTHATSEWFLFEALRRGYRFGVTGGSDGVDGRPGASHPGRMSVRNLRGGLVAVELRELSRGALWAALRAKQTYATTGERILLRFDADGRSFGATYSTTTPPVLTIAVEGTGPLRAVEIFRGTEPVYAAPIAPDDPAPSGEIRISWQGASAPGNWERARMIWDGRLTLSGGKLLEARDFATDTPAEGITAWDATSVAWRSITAGNRNGIVIRPEERAETRLRFESQPLSFEFSLAGLESGPIERRAEDPARCVRIERLPRRPAPSGWAGQFPDSSARPGEHAYWVRVRQDDGAMAWSSPIFVSVEAVP